MWYNLMTDEERENAEFVINLSHGKDSMATIHVAIDILGIPVSRIVAADVWATDTIPADLPPMVEFKRYADGYIKGRWGLMVEHVYATRWGGWKRTFCGTFYELHERGKHIGQLRGFPMQRGSWCKDRLKWAALGEVDLRETVLPHPGAQGPRQSESGGVHRMALSAGTLVQHQAQSAGQSWASRHTGGHGATRISRGQPYGFPISSPNGGNWCTQLKTRVFPRPPAARGEEKYRPYLRHRSRRAGAHRPVHRQARLSSATGGG